MIDTRVFYDNINQGTEIDKNIPERQRGLGCKNGPSRFSLPPLLYGKKCYTLHLRTVYPIQYIIY